MHARKDTVQTGYAEQEALGNEASQSRMFILATT